ncbi:GGDEF domain-containing protein [Bremerella cremea]|uniref:diguanylate cyclase n=1 Tax=Bremerella cremea TaxID=1031537 RepID=A0A368KMC9_9BACT|nr:GGDEF domain-containing protein [Bremerella cremea]RCS41165.1 GGDEF domain-containing protein [Bremerella cremea]
MAELLTFILGDLFGILTLLLGIAVGITLGRMWAAYLTLAKINAAENKEPATNYREQLAGMIQFTHLFSGDLTKQIEQLETLGEKLDSPSDSAPVDDEARSTKAVQLVAEIAAANQRLKRRLESAEATLKTQAQELEDSLSEARTDALTRLFNRRAFDEEQGRRWAHWQRKQQPYCMLLLDIDHFKQVNDKYGHDAGDLVLREVASRLMAVMRETDYLARIGGEELAVLLPEGDWDAIAAVACKLLDAIRRLPVIYGECEIYVTASCGLMSVTHAESSSGLIKGADEALYAAKSNGRNCGYINDGTTLIPIEDLASGKVTALKKVPRDQLERKKPDSSDVNSAATVSDIEIAASELKNRLFRMSQRAC